MADSRIEWTDATWNPVTGCTRASEGCDNCYAVVMTKRLEAMGQEKYAGLVNLGKNHFNGVVRTHEDALLLPLTWKKPRQIFVNSMSDLFHKDVPFEFIDKVFAVMALCPQHVFQVLTKRPDRMAEYLNDRLQPGAGETVGADRRSFISAECYRILEEGGECDPDKDANWTEAGSHRRMGWAWPLPNVWIGSSVEDQVAADERIPHLLKCPAAVRFLSCEPLLGPVDLALTRSDRVAHVLKSSSSFPGFASTGKKESLIHWVICGGESGHKARPMHPDWARSLRDQCQAARVPFFFKQWGEFAPGDQIPPAHSLDPQRPSGFTYRVGKKAAGRLLDGRTWDEVPS